MPGVWLNIIEIIKKIKFKCKQSCNYLIRHKYDININKKSPKGQQW
jgi:hypothetical protein